MVAHPDRGRRSGRDDRRGPWLAARGGRDGRGCRGGQRDRRCGGRALHGIAARHAGPRQDRVGGSSETYHRAGPHRGDSAPRFAGAGPSPSSTTAPDALEGHGGRRPGRLCARHRSVDRPGAGLRSCLVRWTGHDRSAGEPTEHGAWTEDERVAAHRAPDGDPNSDSASARRDVPSAGASNATDAVTVAVPGDPLACGAGADDLGQHRAVTTRPVKLPVGGPAHRYDVNCAHRPRADDCRAVRPVTVTRSEPRSAARGDRFGPGCRHVAPRTAVPPRGTLIRCRPQ